MTKAVTKAERDTIRETTAMSAEAAKSPLTDCNLRQDATAECSQAPLRRHSPRGVECFSQLRNAQAGNRVPALTRQQRFAKAKSEQEEFATALDNQFYSAKAVHGQHEQTQDVEADPDPWKGSWNGHVGRRPEDH